MARRRGAARSAGAVAVVLAVGVTAVAGVVLFLSSRDPAPAREVCAARLDGAEHALSPIQAQNTAMIVGTSVRRGLPARAATIGVATAMQESRIVNIDYGDRDSVGLFQQRPSQGWGTVEQIMDPLYSTGAFYDGLVEVDGWESLEVTDAAQAVQRSAFPQAYAQHEEMARAWASSLTGHSPGSVTCDLPSVTEGDPAGAAGATDLTDRLVRDLGLPQGRTASIGTPAGDGSVTVGIDATALPYDDVTRSTWAVAHWAVATAAATGVTEVRADDQVWTRRAAQWSSVDERDVPAPGTVEVTVGAAG
ncbi:hypothetical protein [Isoptericola aurantiacus]|uniref:hypothetical protein n=1 Tax=Isoptericola aurantiacus TaxID=3377839 RepID=UPI00383AD9F7